VKTTITLICMTGAILSLGLARAQDSVDDVEPTNYCVSADPALGDTAYWAITAVELFSEKKYAEAVEAVDACFAEWGPEGGHGQKALYDEGAKCPRTGKVGKREKQKIDANGLLNDVSMALQCIYMSCGRAWDPKGWYWSPAEDCAKFGKTLVD
jgi:hypothetical protein